MAERLHPYDERKLRVGIHDAISTVVLDAFFDPDGEVNYDPEGGVDTIMRLIEEAYGEHLSA